MRSSHPLRLSRVSPAFLAVCCLSVSGVYASHFRGGFMPLQITAGGQLTGTITALWRKTRAETSFDFSVYSASDTTYSNELAFFTADGSVIDDSNPNFDVAQAPVAFDLSTFPDGQYLIRYDSCCRISGISNVGDDDFSLESRVTKRTGFSSGAPNLSSNIITVIPQGSPYSQNLNASDPDGGGLSYQFLVGNFFPDNGPNSEIPGINVNSRGKILIPASSTSQFTNGQLWVFKVRVTDSQGEYSERDVLLTVVQTGNNPPVIAGLNTETPYQVNPGQTLTINFSATDPDEQIVTLSATGLPSWASFIQTSGNPATGTITLNPTSANAGEFVGINIEAIDDDPSFPLLDSQFIQVGVTAQIDLSLTKSISNINPAVGSNFTFTISVSNAGPNTASNVQVLDLLPAGVTHVSDDSLNTYDPVTGLWQVGSVNSGQTKTLNIVVSRDSAAPITNTAEVFSANGTDPDSTPNNNNPSEDDQASAGTAVYTHILPPGLSLISVPFEVSNKNPASLFGIPASELQMAVFDSSLTRTTTGDYVYFNGSATDPNLHIQLGNGYWVNFPGGGSFGVEGGVSSPDPNQRYRFPVNQGWFQIGNPWKGALPWKLDDIFVYQNNNKVGTLADQLTKPFGSRSCEMYCYTYDNAAGTYRFVFDPKYSSRLVDPNRAITEQLEVADGAFMYFQQPNLSLEFPGVQPAAAVTSVSHSRRARTSRGHNWTAELRAQCGEAVSGGNLLGQSDAFSASSGGFQAFKPPMALHKGSWVDLSFLPQGNQPRDTAGGSLWGIDLRPRSLSTVWRAVVQTNAPGQNVSLTWPDLSQVPSALRFTLVDEATGKRQAMRTTSAYQFRADEGGRPFRIELSDAESTRLRISNLTAAGAGLRSGGNLSISFSLSQTANVQLRLLSPAGRTIASLPSDLALKEGLNWLTLPARAGSGGFLPRGTYLLELIATTPEQQQVRAVRAVGLR